MARADPAIQRGASVASRKFRLPQPDLLENLRQQVYLELLRDDRKVLRTYQGRSDLEGWVAVIAMRTAYSLLARRAKERPLPDLLPSRPTPSPGELAERSEVLDRLDRAFRLLTARERDLLRFGFFEKLPYKEIARRLDLPINSVSPLLIRAQERLKSRMEKA